MQYLVLPPFTDWHLHVRQGDLLPSLVLASARTCSRALIMPNTIPPVTNAAAAARYKEEILTGLAAAARQAGLQRVPEFEPLMTLYMTDNTTEQDLEDAKVAGVVAVKLYPKGATTNSSTVSHAWKA